MGGVRENEDWTIRVDPGEYEIEVGAGSDEVRLRAKVVLP